MARIKLEYLLLPHNLHHSLNFVGAPKASYPGSLLEILDHDGNAQ
jgi:hypothetical protein